MMTTTPVGKGHCKHGEFDLKEGCPQCIADRTGAKTNDVATAFGIEETEKPEELKEADIDYPDIVLVCRGGCGKTTEGMTMETKAGEFKQVDESGVPEWTCLDCLTKNAQQLETETALAKSPGADVEVMSYYNEALKLRGYAESRVIATLEDSKAATDDLSLISKLKKVMENKRKSLLDPLKLQSDAIRETYNYLMAPVLEADKITRDKMVAYDAEQRRIRAEQEEINRKRQEAAEAEMKLKGELTESVNLVEVVPEPAKRVATDLGTAGMVDCWKYEVVDLLAIPREYLVVDTAMLNAITKRHHDQKQIPGVRFYNEPTIAVRTR